MMTNTITIWQKYNHKLQVYEHNHIEDGYCAEPVPTPVSDSQKSGWVGAKWRGKLGLLINGIVVPWMQD